MADDQEKIEIRRRNIGEVNLDSSQPMSAKETTTAENSDVVSTHLYQNFDCRYVYFCMVSYMRLAENCLLLIFFAMVHNCIGTTMQ